MRELKALPLTGAYVDDLQRQSGVFDPPYDDEDDEEEEDGPIIT